MKILSILLLTISLFTSLHAQERIKVNLFKSTNDYISKSYSETNVTLLVREIGKNHIWFKKFIDDETGKKIKNIHTSWAIEYNGDTYFNLGYSLDLNNWKVFIKLNLEGNRYCMSFIDDNPPNIIKNSGMNYGGGLQGALMSESSKWGKSWKNNKGERIKILFIDLLEEKVLRTTRDQKASGNLLTKRDLKTKFGLKKSNAEIKQMSFEEILNIIATKESEK